MPFNNNNDDNSSSRNSSSSPAHGIPSLAALAAQERVQPEEMHVGQFLAGGKYKVIDLVQNHRVLGLTYNVINQQGDGFIAKVDAEANLLSFVRSEAGFLQAVNKNKSAEFFVELVHGARFKGWIYFITRFRAGPSINDCWCSSPTGKFSPATAARIAYFHVKALEVVHQLGYLLRRVDPTIIKFDVALRQVYLSDLSSTRLDPCKMKMNELPVKWAGPATYAPLQHHQGKSHTVRHDLEAVVYFLVEMTLGSLPWDGTPPDMIGSVKRQSVTKQSLFTNCPPQYAAMYTLISCLADNDRIEYSQIYSKLEETWKTNGIKDVNDPYDFEERMKK